MARRAECAWLMGAAGSLAGVLWVSACGRSEPEGAVRPGAPAMKTGAGPGAPAADGGGGEGEAAAALVDGGPGWLAAAWAPGMERVKMRSAHAAFALSREETLSPGLPAAGLNASYNGVLSPSKGRYRFSVAGEGGRARLAVYGGAGAKLGEAESVGALAQTGWIALDGGPVSVTVSYERAGDREARLQTFWEKQGTGAEGGFVREPLPVSAVAVPAHGARDAAQAESELRGRVLLGELGCVACHETGAEHDGVLERRGPLLGEIGRRASPEWIRAWIENPQALREGAAMPDVIGDSPEDLADAEAITHLLVGMGGPSAPEPVATETRVVDLGRRLYHSVGCVSCHGALEPGAEVFGEGTLNTSMPESLPPRPFGKVMGKWRASALSAFLRDPLATHPSGRMPDMGLSEEESDLIATYLMNRWGGGGMAASFAVDPAQVERGRAAFAARGCADCHSIGHNLAEIASAKKSPPLGALRSAAGCLSADAGGTPRYTLSERDRRDLAAGIESVKRIAAGKSSAAAPLDEGERVMLAMNCRACHEMNGAGGVPDELNLYYRTVDDTELGDEGRMPPRLTGAGFKLHASWMRKVLVDGERVRPSMATRMPRFGEGNVGELGALLAKMEGVHPGKDELEPESRDEMVLAGRTLVGEKGLNCISCHTFDGKTTGTPGPEITGFGERLRYEWWRAYVMDPGRFKPGTRMTAFYSHGRGDVKNIYGGEPSKQIDAMWAYFNTGKFGPAPEGLPTGQGMPVAIGDRPVVFRTFLKDAGSRGIAVGYPIGMHFGFDAEQVRLVSAWTGEFVDATSAWKGRGGMVAGGQGARVWRAPGGPPLVISAERPSAWPTETGRKGGYAFRGYRLEKDGTPVFMYSVGSVEVEERFEPAPGGMIRRTFTVRGAPEGQGVWYRRGGEVVGDQMPRDVARIESGDGIEGLLVSDVSGEITFSLTIRPEGGAR